MKLLIDMNLSPLWVEFFERNGLYAVHWSRIIGNLVLAGIAQFRDMLGQGALITLNESTARARILPLTR